MKSIMSIPLFIAFFVLAFSMTSKAQIHPAMDIVTVNPNAEADTKVVKDYYTALAAADTIKVKSLMGEKFMLYGPSAADSSNAQKELLNWAKNYQIQQNRSVTFITHSFTVPEGQFAGNWVGVWGKYHCTIHDIEISVPFQSTCKVENGKISNIYIYYDNLSVRNQLNHSVPTPKR